MSEEHDSWFKQAFGIDLGESVRKIKDQAVGVVEQATTTVTSSFPLVGSVGRGGRNAPNDVRAVQTALGITADGHCGGQTIEAIEAFQRRIGTAKPDGRVDAGGPTERALTGASKLTPAPGSSRNTEPTSDSESESDSVSLGALPGSNTLTQLEQESGPGQTPSRPALITKQDNEPKVYIRSSKSGNYHDVVIGEAGEISLNLQLARVREDISELQVIIDVNLGLNSATGSLLLDYVDVGENLTLISRKVTVPKGPVSVWLAASRYVLKGKEGDETTLLAQGRLELLGR